MVWIKLIIFCLTFLSSIHASELSQEEITYFNIMDLNNDHISPKVLVLNENNQIIKKKGM